jgi:16S rRNA (cytosine967-C5)-methyltransferase
VVLAAAAAAAVLCDRDERRRAFWMVSALVLAAVILVGHIAHTDQFRSISNDAGKFAALCDGGRFSPEPLTEAERSALSSRSLAEAPAHVAGDYPEWLDGHLAQAFGDDRVAEATAMASRAPLDLRVNTLKANREKMLPSLAHLGVAPTPWSPIGLRIELGADARNPGIHAEEDFIKGAVEVQDEGSQLAAAFSAAKPGDSTAALNTPAATAAARATKERPS